ncbi:unnamed protein product [Ilex paraguariensis]|uniref:Uncharacterized protein n=1 Tax=Ilex paraguariensis TaxID=185542 RepID=A0ABC8SVS0_9AQUA
MACKEPRVLALKGTQTRSTEGISSINAWLTLATSSKRLPPELLATTGLGRLELEPSTPPRKGLRCTGPTSELRDTTPIVASPVVGKVRAWA